MFKMLEWDPKYEIGVKEIDLQHHYFIELINRVAEELKQPISEKYKNRLLDELYKYAAFHFISEENLMLKYNFPEFDQGSIESDPIEVCGGAQGMGECAR